MSTPFLPEFKRGDTFTASCIYKLDGVPTSLDGLTVASQVRKLDGTLVDSLTVTMGDQITSPGTFTLSAISTQTAIWPVLSLRCDVQFSSGESVSSTETFMIPVIQDVTQ